MTCYVHTAATSIILNEKLDTQTYFTEVHNVFVFQKILNFKSHHLLIRFNIQRILIEMVQVSKTHTLHTEKDNFRKG